MTPQWRHKWRHVKNTKITKNRQNHGFSLFFRYFFKQTCIFLAMMCVKVCLHMFLLQINQINEIKHSESVSWKQKTRFVCKFHCAVPTVKVSFRPTWLYPWLRCDMVSLKIDEYPKRHFSAKGQFLETSFWSVFRWTQRSITQRRVITLGPIFKKMVLNWAQGLKEKSHEVSARKNNNRLRYNKKCRGGRISPPPRLF